MGEGEAFAWRIIPGLGSVVNDRGDRFCPQDHGVVRPFLNGRPPYMMNGAYGMILPQVRPDETSVKPVEKKTVRMVSGAQAMQKCG